MANRQERLSATDIIARRVEESLDAGLYSRTVKNATVGLDGVTLRGAKGERFGTLRPTVESGEVIFNSDPGMRRQR